MISLDGVLYWAISCFNYGDDPVFDRQRYGPAWIITSHDKGFALQMMDFALKMMKFVLKMMDFALKMMDFARQRRHLEPHGHSH